MDGILQALHEVEGVQASLVLNATGQLLGHRAHAVFDGELLQEVSRTIVNAVDSLQLVHDDWEVVSATFSEGKLLMRNLGAGRQSAAGPAVLAVVADARLNPSFAGIAMRVAASRLRGALQAPAAAAPRPGAGLPAGRPALSVVQAAAAPARSATPAPVPARTSAVVDAPGSIFLSAITRALAGSVGPMARVFVNEAVSGVCGGAPFSREHVPALIAVLEAHIDDPGDRAQFRKAMSAV